MNPVLTQCSLHSMKFKNIENMRNEVKIVQCTTEELKALIHESVKTALAQLKRSLAQDPSKKLLTRKEVCTLFSINLSTLWAWTKKGKLPCHRLGNRVYYKLEEVEKCLTKSNPKP